jgi:hypothetical protein
LESYKISKTTNSSSATHQKKDGIWVRNNLEKATTFAQHLKKRFHAYPGLDTLPVLNSNDYLDKIPLATPREVAEEIRTNLNPKEHLDLISSQENFLRTLKEKALVKLTTLINACIRLNYIPDAWKTAEVIMIPKRGKNLSEVESYRPISLLPIMSKLFEKLILKRFKPIIADKHLVPTHQFTRQETRCIVSLTSLKILSKTKACALLSFLTLHKLSTEYGIEAYFIN